ncbi:MAG: glycosyltransferase family 2 protein [Myxococcota bacterium]|jgi:glycosyltransferase involved in cell wall biosynthesis|nr:glycosyltransferase family 2 protein [Myxococcota bacterium]
MNPEASTPAIGFAIPFYRDVEMLRLAIESVLEQTRTDWALVVIDDSGEELGVETLVAGFRDDRISYQRNPGNLGMVATWNRGIDLATSDLVTLLHADDRLLPHYAASMIELAARHPDAAALYCEAEIIDESGRHRFSMADWVKGFLRPSSADGVVILKGEAAVADLMAGYFIMTPTLCYRTSRLAERRFDPRWRQVQDLMFIVGLLVEGHTVVGTRETAYAYRRHAASATSVQSESLVRFDEEVEAFDAIANELESLGWLRAAHVAHGKRIIKLHLLYRVFRSLSRLRLAAAAEALRYRLRLR